MRRQFEALGRPVPLSAIEPELGGECIFFLQAFLELQHDRNEYGFIPFTSINEYAKRYELTGGLFEEFRSVVRAVNVAVNAHFAEKRDRDQAKK